MMKLNRQLSIASGDTLDLPQVPGVESMSSPVEIAPIARTGAGHRGGV